MRYSVYLLYEYKSTHTDVVTSSASASKVSVGAARQQEQVGQDVEGVGQGGLRDERIH
jgi:hypothetical protein